MTKKARFDYMAEQQPEEQAKPEVLTQLAQQPAARLALSQPESYALPAQRRGKRTEPGPKRTDVAREQLNVRIRPELKRAAAGLAGLQGMTLGDVVEAALIEYLKQHG